MPGRGRICNCKCSRGGKLSFLILWNFQSGRGKERIRFVNESPSTYHHSLYISSILKTHAPITNWRHLADHTIGYWIWTVNQINDLHFLVHVYAPSSKLCQGPNTRKMGHLEGVVHLDQDLAPIMSWHAKLSVNFIH